MQTWRLIPLLEAPGIVQMALDEWLLEQHQQGLHPPTLRFYTWNPAAISLGYHQRRWPQHWQNLTWKGRSIDLVRRPSGGRAVLHDGDLTYAVITSGLAGTRIQAYQAICEFLIEGWRSLGIDLHYGQAGKGYIDNPNCFGTPTNADLVTADGFKLIGSAQLYRKTTILQHGSMQLQPNYDLFQHVFGIAPTCFQLPVKLDGQPFVEIVVSSLVEAASKCFQINFHVEPLSETEWQTILLQSEKMAPLN